MNTQPFEDAVREALNTPAAQFEAAEVVERMKVVMMTPPEDIMEAHNTAEAIAHLEAIMGPPAEVVKVNTAVVSQLTSGASTPKKDTTMLIEAIATKLDKNKAWLTSCTESSVWEKGRTLYSNVFGKYDTGTMLTVIFKFSPTGRRMIYAVSPVAKAAVVAEAQVGVSAKATPQVVVEPKTVTADMLAGYFISPEARMNFTTAKKMSSAKPDRAVKIMMVGPSGYGKTTLPKIFSDITGANFLRMNCATIRDPEEWFGWREAREGSTVFIKSRFAQAIEAGNLVVILDEFNRLEPWLHNTLFPLLDDDGRTVVHDEEFTIGPNVIVVGTINTGYRYTGTFELDEALMNRFDFILEVGPMPFEEEVKVLQARTGIALDTAKGIVKIATVIRGLDIVCSTRTTLLMASMMVSGMSIREAVESAVIRRIPSDTHSNSTRKSVVDAVNAQIGPFASRTLVDDIFNVTKPQPAKAVEAPKVELAPTFIISMSEKDKFQPMEIVKTLTKIDTVSGTHMTYQQAKTIADRLLEGNVIAVPILKELSVDELKVIADELSANGVKGRYGKRPAVEVGTIVNATFANFGEKV
jgi:hypothetical protein